MPLLRQNRQRTGKSVNWTYVLDVALAFVLFPLSCLFACPDLDTCRTSARES